MPPEARFWLKRVNHFRLQCNCGWERWLRVSSVVVCTRVELRARAKLVYLHPHLLSGPGLNRWFSVFPGRFVTEPQKASALTWSQTVKAVIGKSRGRRREQGRAEEGEGWVPRRVEREEYKKKKKASSGEQWTINTESQPQTSPENLTANKNLC